MTLVDAASFGRFVAALPPSMELALTTDDTVSTAFFNALRSNWSEEDLTFDAQATQRRGGGVGMIVTRLRTLAARNPVVRTPAGPRDRYVPPDVPITPPEWVAERMALLRKFNEGATLPDDCEAAMAALIAIQRDR